MARTTANKENMEQAPKNKAQTTGTGKGRNNRPNTNTNDSLDNNTSPPLPPRLSTRRHVNSNDPANDIANSPEARGQQATNANMSHSQPAGISGPRIYPATPRPPPRHIQAGFTGGTPLHAGTPRPRPAPPAAPTTSDDDDDDVAILKAKLAAAEAREVQLRSRLASKGQQPTIHSIPKPKGEAGDDKRGFNLRRAMELDGSDDDFLYADILRAIRRNAERAGIDFARTYREQDHEVLARVFKAGRKDFEYLCRERFPNDWAQAEILKQYLKNSRRYQARLQRERAAATSSSAGSPSVKRKRLAHSNPIDTNAAETPDAGPSRRLHKRRHLEDDDDEVEEEDNEACEYSDEDDDIYG